MELVVTLAMVTHTPIPFFLDQPLNDLKDWADVAAAALKKKNKGAN